MLVVGILLAVNTLLGVRIICNELSVDSYKVFTHRRLRISHDQADINIAYINYAQWSGLGYRLHQDWVYVHQEVVLLMDHLSSETFSNKSKMIHATCKLQYQGRLLILMSPNSITFALK